ncbi:MAG TPA: TonB-dependent receptor [Gemmatimonadales bacterium]|jgi:outer membrane receptor protein involved in Fe transport|nr:TonB-dependent receptor [Gemmatimonadales bacterium]
MSWRLTLVALVATPLIARAQQPVPRDSIHQHGDSLTRRPIELAPVTVTTTPARREDPGSVAHVSAQVIQRTPATDAYDLLRQTAGIEVHAQGQGPGFASDASVRGFSSDHSTDLALWVDGVPNNEPVNGHAEGYNDWNLLFPQALAAIDVLKGPTSALYGNFAMSGVVNARTVERFRGVSLWLDPGSHGRAESAVLAGFDHDTTAGVFGLRGVHEDGWRPHSAYTLGQAHARLVHQLAPATTLDAGVELYATGWDSPGYLTDAHFTAGAYNIVANPTDGGFKRRAQERLSLRVLANAGLLWRTTLYATQGRWQLYLTIPPAGGTTEGSGSQTEEEDRRYGFGLTSALTWVLPRAEITLGTEGRWDHASYENWFTTNRARDSAQTVVTARQASGALFLQSTEDVTPHLRLMLGGRLDALDTRDAPAAPAAGGVASYAKAVVSPKFGALYHLGLPVDLYANASRGFRQTDGVITDPTLPFITEWAYETGIKLDTRRMSGSIALYRMDVSNEQTVNPVTLAATSGGASRRQGVELELEARPSGGVALGTDWTFNDARYRQLIRATGDTTHPADTLSGTRVFNTAKYVGTVVLELAPRAALWHLRASANLVGPYSPFDEPGVLRPAYGLIHLSGGVRLGHTGLELGVRNVGNTAYRELEAGGFVSPGEPRTVYATLRYGW